MGFDPSGNLYVLEVKPGAESGTIVVYAAGTASVVRAIPVRDATSLALDAAGNLYVNDAKADAVTVYAAGGDSMLRVIRQNIVDPSVVLIGAGNLYVANAGYRTPPKTGSFISDFEPATAAFPKVIYTGGSLIGLALDAASNLYGVGNDRRGDGWVAVYRPPSSVASRVISDGIRDPAGIAIDNAGNLFVANVAFGQVGGGNVAVYDAGSTSPVGKIFPKDADPVGPIAIGP
jgi:sugar lactone lactonase YvrE